MIVMTYTNTANGILLPNGNGNSDRKVLVSSKTKGQELIAAWNVNSKNHCKGIYRYAATNFEPATKHQMETMDLY